MLITAEERYLFKLSLMVYHPPMISQGVDEWVAGFRQLRERNRLWVIAMTYIAPPKLNLGQQQRKSNAMLAPKFIFKATAIANLESDLGFHRRHYSKWANGC
jgi:hypothetical protein